MMSILNLWWIVPLVAAVAWGWGYKANPERVRAFVKAHIVDDDPYQDEGHSATRYAPESGESPIAREARKAAEVGTQVDYIDWSKVPDGYDWVAVDGPLFDGTLGHTHVVGAFTVKPQCDPDCWNSPRDNRDDMVLPDNAIIGPLPPWRESLRRRPS